LLVVREGGAALNSKVIDQRYIDGPICETLRLSGRVGSRRAINFAFTVKHFKSAKLVKIEATLHNPRRAQHIGGFWDLGDPQSEWLESAALSFTIDLTPERSVRWLERTDDHWHETSAARWSLLQLNSGGQNWQSRVHVDAQGHGLTGNQGYKVEFDDKVIRGTRATPTVAVSDGAVGLKTTMVDFWEKFPSGIAVDGKTLLLQMFPKQPDRNVELQGGEKTTRTIWLQLGQNDIGTSDLSWVHKPLVAISDLYGLAKTGGLEWLTEDSRTPPSQDEIRLPDEMLSGPRNFFWKREQVDEFGWRNFGDFWADHEEKYSDDRSPVISHYNQQYDLLYGLLRQYLRTRDCRWWDLARPLAEHVIDIDIYDTKGDRSAYNGGMFWHTSHYRDAGTCTHRSYSRHMVGEKHPVHGGGLSNEHNYTTGLLLYYFLTGTERAKEAVLSLADWVIAMDDGEQHLLAPLSSARTGNASSTAETTFHGPGRGAGNSINSLLDGWQLTREAKYLDKLTELIYRVVHPNDSPDEFQLRNAELRWSYTVCLQALLRYLEIADGQVPDLDAYIRASLRTYGVWMMENESLYLDKPEELEFPTETWAAQDLRKGTTMMLIGRTVVGGEQGERMYQRGREHFLAAWERLRAFETRDYTRPMAIALQQLPIYRYALTLKPLPADAVLSAGPRTWPPKTPFRTQKQQIRDQFRSPLGIARMTLRALRPRPWIQTFRQSRFFGVR
jgi:hypothetical protein